MFMWLEDSSHYEIVPYRRRKLTFKEKTRKKEMEPESAVLKLQVY